MLQQSRSVGEGIPKTSQCLGAGIVAGKALADEVLDPLGKERLQLRRGVSIDECAMTQWQPKESGDASANPATTGSRTSGHRPDAVTASTAASALNCSINAADSARRWARPAAVIL